MAVSREGAKSHLIHHSDRGIQYCCYDYVNYLKGSGTSISMTENGDPYQNVIAERFNGILKDEYELGETFSNYQAALEAVNSAVSKYNYIRPHRSLGFMVPLEAHEQNGPLKKHWRNRKHVPKVESGIADVPVLINQE